MSHTAEGRWKDRGEGRGEGRRVGRHRCGPTDEKETVVLGGSCEGGDVNDRGGGPYVSTEEVQEVYTQFIVV